MILTGYPELQGGTNFSVTIIVTDNGTNPDNQIDSEIITICVNENSFDCVLSEWSAWSDCGAICGGGQQFRTRDILVANYTLIAEQEIFLHSSNKVESGGVGVTSFGGKIKLHHLSYIADFAKASKIETHIWSWVGERFYAPADVEVPEFIFNTISNNRSQDVRIRYNKTEILDGDVYGKIEIQDRAKVTFTGSNVYLDELILNSNASVEFAGCANVFVNKKLVVGYNSTFNSAGNAVKVFVDGDVLVLGGSSVTAQIQSAKHIHAMGWYFRSINMIGLFIAKKIHGFISVNWNKFEFPSPFEIEEPVIVDNIEGNVNYDAEFAPSSQVSGMYLYRLTLGDEVFNGKVIYKK